MHGGPAPLGFGAGVGFGVMVQFGVPEVAAWVSFADVKGPTMPSTASPAAVWNQRIAASVSPPSLPSTGPAWHASELS